MAILFILSSETSNEWENAIPWYDSIYFNFWIWYIIAVPLLFVFRVSNFDCSPANSPSFYSIEAWKPSFNLPIAIDFKTRVSHAKMRNWGMMTSLLCVIPGLSILWNSLQSLSQNGVQEAPHSHHLKIVAHPCYESAHHKFYSLSGVVTLRSFD